MVDQTLPLGDLIIAIALGLVIFRAGVFLLGALWHIVDWLTGLITALVTLCVRASFAIVIVFIIYTLINNVLHV